MLYLLVKKELADNMRNSRFSAGILLSVTLIVASMVILSGQYQNEIDDYNRRLERQDAFLNEYGHLNRAGAFIDAQEPPSPMMPVALGNTKTHSFSEFVSDPMPLLFPVIDLVFIISVVLSLVAILFSYDAITRDRENGMLKLVVTYTVSRPTILLSKWIAGMLTLMIPLLFSFICGMLYISFDPSIAWGGLEFASALLLLLGGLCYISVFYILGMMTSSFSRYSGISIVLAFFIWIAAVLTIPNISPFIAARIYPLPSTVETNRIIDRMGDEERDQLWREMLAQSVEKLKETYGSAFDTYASTPRQEMESRIKGDETLAAIHTAYRKAFDDAVSEANSIQKEKIEKIQNDLARKKQIQTKLATFFACVSPYSNFLFFAADLTGTGMLEDEHFTQSQKDFGQIVYDYVINKYQNARIEDPSFSAESFIDLSDRPRYVYKATALSTRLASVAPYWGMLVFFNALLFFATFVKFSRYDVR